MTGERPDVATSGTQPDVTGGTAASTAAPEVAYNARRASQGRTHPKVAAAMLIALGIALGWGLERLLAILQATIGASPNPSVVSGPVTPVCDGQLDETELLQAMIRGARGPDGVGREVRLPPGVCVVSDTLVVRGVTGLSIRGAGPMATRIQWRGPNDRPGLLFDRALRCEASNLTVEAAEHHRLMTAIQFQQGGPCNNEPGCSDAMFSSGNLLDRVHVRGDGRIATGIQVALTHRDADRLNDRHRFQNVHVATVTENAFDLQGINAKQIQLFGVTCSGRRMTRSCVNTATVRGRGAAFQWTGGMSTGMVNADFVLGGRNDTLLIQGLYSEKSTRFLLVQDGVGEQQRDAPYPTLIEGVRWASGQYTAKDGEIVRFRSAGPLTIRSSRFGRQTPRGPIRFLFAPVGTRLGAARGAFIFEGNFVGSSDPRLFPADQPSRAEGNLLRVGSASGLMDFGGIGDSMYPAAGQSAVPEAAVAQPPSVGQRAAPPDARTSAAR